MGVIVRVRMFMVRLVGMIVGVAGFVVVLGLRVGAGGCGFAVGPMSRLRGIGVAPARQALRLRRPELLWRRFRCGRLFLS